MVASGGCKDPLARPKTRSGVSVIRDEWRNTPHREVNELSNARGSGACGCEDRHPHASQWPRTRIIGRVALYVGIVRNISTSTDKILVHVAGAVGWITVNNPAKRNALSGEMFRGLAEAAADLEDADDVRVVVVRGAGEKAFISGADIGDLGSGVRGDQSTDPTEGPRLLEISKPVIAMIHGYCIGGGLVVALRCDLRVCADDARFAVPAGRLGVGYPVDSLQQLTALIGPEQTSRLLFTGATIDASAAVRIGLVGEVVPKAELEHRVQDLAAGIATQAPLTLRATKLAVAATVRGSQVMDLAAARAATAACWASADFAEGRAAFADKRSPLFVGA
jgi:enoyl-CoA hydratase